MNLLLVLALLLLPSPGPVRAADLLEIPAECGSESELVREVTALRASAAEGDARARPDVHLWRERDGYVLEVALPEGTRSLRDRDCRALFRAAIVIAALGHEVPLDPLTVQDPARSGPAQVVPPSAAQPRARDDARAAPVPHVASAGASGEDTRASAAQPPAHRLAARALLDAGASYGLTPVLSAALGFGVALEYARFAARVTFTYHTPSSEHGDDGGVRVDALSAALTLEVVALPWLRPGIGADFAALHGQGLGGANPTSAWASQPMLHASLALRLLQRRRFGLELAARALWAPEPARFLMRGRSIPVYTTSPWGLAVAFAASYQFLFNGSTALVGYIGA